ncbi:MAG: hypothetical protein MJ237_07715 [bacterium]|nr:hypothetical protein [bacterium]
MRIGSVVGYYNNVIYKKSNNFSNTKNVGFRALSDWQDEEESPLSDHLFGKLNGGKEYNPNHELHATPEEQQRFIDKILGIKPCYSSSTGMSMYALPLEGVELVNGLKNTYRGSSIRYLSPEYLKVLKDHGIDRFIDLDVLSIDIDKLNKAGIDYCPYDIYTNWQEGANKDDYATKNFAEKFVNFAENLSKGNSYIGCDWGTLRTDLALTLYNLVMPDDKQIPTKKYDVLTSTILDNFSDMYKLALTEADKLRLGISKEFDSTFHERIKDTQKLLRTSSFTRFI